MPQGYFLTDVDHFSTGTLSRVFFFSFSFTILLCYRFDMEGIIDVYAAFDDELNPAPVVQNTMPDESYGEEEHILVKVIPRGNSKPEENKDNREPSLVKAIPQGNPRRKRSRWDSVSSDASVTNDVSKSPPHCLRPLSHWREIIGVGIAGIHHGDDLGKTRPENPVC